MNTVFQHEPDTGSDFSIKELKVLDTIARSSRTSQRQLAQKSGLSLGIVNLILRRLAKTGYIKVSSLSKHKMHYLLTPKALSDQSQRFYHYLVRTIRVYEEYRKRIEALIDEQVQKGQKKFIVYGEGDIVDLVKVALSRQNGQVRYRVCLLTDQIKPSVGELPLYCHWQGKSPVEGVSVLEKILMHQP